MKKTLFESFYGLFNNVTVEELIENLKSQKACYELAYNISTSRCFGSHQYYVLKFSLPLPNEEIWGIGANFVELYVEEIDNELQKYISFLKLQLDKTDNESVKKFGKQVDKYILSDSKNFHYGKCMKKLEKTTVIGIYDESNSPIDFLNFPLKNKVEKEIIEEKLGLKLD